MKSEEYTSLRNEIMQLVNIQNNYIIAMYTITIAILSLAIQQDNEWLFLLPYIILFSFQRIISVKNDGMLRIAAYIAVFLDEEIGWEKKYNDIVDALKSPYRSKFSQFMNIISGRISSLQLGLVCSIGCTIFCLKNMQFDIYDIQNVNLWDAFPIVIGVILFFCLQIWCRGTFRNMGVRKEYIDKLEILKKKYQVQQECD